MKNLFRFTITLFIALTIFSITSNATVDWATIKSQADSFVASELSPEIANQATFEEKDVAPLVNGLADILTTIGVIVVLGALLIMGIKYMTATPEEAAKLKTQLIGVAIAGIVILGAFSITIPKSCEDLPAQMIVPCLSIYALFLFS